MSVSHLQHLSHKHNNCEYTNAMNRPSGQGLKYRACVCFTPKSMLYRENESQGKYFDETDTDLQCRLHLQSAKLQSLNCTNRKPEPPQILREMRCFMQVISYIGIGRAGRANGGKQCCLNCCFSITRAWQPTFMAEMPLLRCQNVAAVFKAKVTDTARANTAVESHQHCTCPSCPLKQNDFCYLSTL